MFQLDRSFQPDSTTEERISRQLTGEERLLWTGTPRRGLILRGADPFLIPFSLMWGGFAVFWELLVITSGAPLFFVFWGIPFVALGLYITVGRFIVDARIRARTVYGLTNRRALIISGLWNESIQSIPLQNLEEISLTERRDGSGTISLGRPNPFALWSSGLQWTARRQRMTPTSERIENAKAVHDQILRMQRDPV